MKLTIRRKMVIYIGVPAALISLATMAWVLSFAEHQARKLGEAEMAEMAASAAARLEEYIGTASRIADTRAKFVSRMGEFSEDEIYGMLKDSLGVSERIYGAAMAFEPGSFKHDDSLFAPYAYRGKEGVEQMNVDESVYDWYRDEQWEWWHTPKKTEKGEWIDPFFDTGAGDIWMTTYSAPFFDKIEGEDRKFRGVTTVDINIETLRDEIAESLPELGRFIVLGPKGQIIIAPVKEQEYFMEKTIYQLLEAKGKTDLTDNVKIMLGGGSGEESLDAFINDEPTFYAYAPVPSPGWTMLTYKAEKAALAEFYSRGNFVVICFIGSIVLIIGFTIFTSGRLAKPIRKLQDKVLRIADGETGVPLGDIGTRDEIEDLANAFGTMRGKVVDREKKLESARETTLTEILESAPDPMLVVDDRGRIHRFNSKVSDIFGYSSEDLVDMTIEQLMPEAFQAEQGEMLKESFLNPGTRQMGGDHGFLGLHKNGRGMPLEIGTSVLHDKGEKMAVAVIRDITERKKSEKEIKQKEKQFRTLVSNIPGTVFRCLKDRHWTMKFMSEDVEQLTGYPASDFLDNEVRSFASVIQEEDRDRVFESINRAITENQEWQIEYQINHRDGGSRWINETGRAIFNEDGTVGYLDGVMVDISTRKEMEKQLNFAREQAEAANRAKSEFLSHMSHELRTPLNGVLGYAQILYRSPDVTDSQRKSLDAIVNCGDHLLSLINDVLDLSKIEAGKIEIEESACDLHNLITGVGNILSPKAKSKGLKFTMDVSAEVPVAIKTDPAKIRQILVNLLGNAVKFTDKGEVKLKVNETTDNRLRMAVSDSGIGIKPEELELIFDPFKQVEAGKAAGGTGLGLAITKRLSEMLGGTLEVKSVYGEGSTFTLTIPLVEVAEEELDELEFTAFEPTEAKLAEGQDFTILVTDDRETNRDILDQILRDMGFNVILADDGDVALERLEQNPKIDLALMDVRMPRVNGIEVVKHVRASEKLRDLPVIAVTASVFPQFKEKALASGFDDFLGKPFRATELVTRLKTHLNAKFVAERQEKPTDPIKTEDDSGTITIPEDILEKLRAALKIRNLTAINNLAKQLVESGETEIGELIGKHARAFDFSKLSELAENQ